MLSDKAIYSETLNFLKNHNTDSEELMVDIVNFQIKRIKVYRNFLEHMGIKEVKDIEDIHFFPVEAFKITRVFSGKEDGFFLSSGTAGEQSKVFYTKKSLLLYEVSAIEKFPFKGRKIYSLIPSFECAKNSSLSFMLSVFERRLGLEFLDSASFFIDPEEAFSEIEKKVKNGDILFLSSTQLFQISKENRGRGIEKEIIIIETGGYKKLKKNYSRKKLYEFSKKTFPLSIFHSEYGMAEIFSQFYTDETGYKIDNNPYVFNKKGGLLKVFDFANLYTVSALLVPDKIRLYKDKRHFEIVRRITGEVRGCGYVFS